MQLPTLTQALTAAKRLVQEDHVFAVIAMSGVFFSAAPYLHSAGVPVVGANYDGSEWLTNDNMFSIYGYNDYTKVQTGLGQEMKMLGGTNLGTIGYSISPSSAATTRGFAASAQAAGLKAGYVNPDVPFGSTNVGPLVLAMKSAKIDSFFPVTDTNTGLAAIVGLRQQNVDLKAAWLAEGQGDLLASGPATERAATGVYFGGSYEPVQMNTPATKQFQSDLKTFSGVTALPSLNQYLSYLSIDGVVQGLKASPPHPTQAQFIQAMLGITSYDAAGLLGSHPFSFAMSTRGKDAGTILCQYLTEWTGSQFVLVPGIDPLCGSYIPGLTVSSSS
jgi:branched-chain amino acid transport system substrate-binding protein